MGKHLADHRKPSDGGRLKHFLRLARDRREAIWRNVWQRPVVRLAGNRRLVEFIRIARANRG